MRCCLHFCRFVYALWGLPILCSEAQPSKQLSFKKASQRFFHQRVVLRLLYLHKARALI